MIFLKALEEKILKEGQVFPGNILKVGNFLNHRLDTEFLLEMGEEIARLFKDSGVNKILTIETSGIAIAFAAACHMKLPVVFAKKDKSGNISDKVYSSRVESFTRKNVYDAVVSKEYLGKGDKVLVIDDFLAKGNALNGLMDIEAAGEKSEKEINGQLSAEIDEHQGAKQGIGNAIHFPEGNK